ncbi:MAG: dihydropteroate synthase [Bacteroidetes bacterium]|nr:dihydropteroate synthase [Bacteroidota bacterium]
MGVLNVTPDSFYDGGKYRNLPEIEDRVRIMIREGVDIIDIGAVSTRPNAEDVSEKEELKRLIPVLEGVRNLFPDIFISVDTWRSTVASLAAQSGADMINDISGGGYDKNMAATVAELQLPFVVMHTKGDPKNMQNNPTYNNVVYEISNYFETRIKDLTAKGISQVIIDPGFGFGKTIGHNYEILRSLSRFSAFKLPIMVGLSRKSMIYKTLNITPDQSLNATSVTNTLALMNGANILRVHDVKEAVETIKIVTKITE